MLARIRKAQEENESGFTLIELLVVIIIIGILAAIAIPTFLNQRQKGWDAASKSALKNAATAQESYYTEANPSSYGTEAQIETEGFKQTANITFTVVTNNATTYCMEAFHASNATKVWKLSSTDGAPVVGTCAAPAPAPAP